MEIPGDTLTESGVAFRLDPYRYIGRRCDELGTDVFRTRLLLEETICLRGREASELFHDARRFERAGAAPDALVKTLVGEGGVQGLDGEAHRHRKSMFMRVLMTSSRIRQLEDAFEAEWEASEPGWAGADRVVLYEAMHRVLGRAVCAWAGVELSADEEAQRLREMVALFDDAGSAGPGHVWSRLCRTNADAWAGRVIEDVRAGRRAPGPDTAAHVIATHRGLDGERLSTAVAAVELLNVLRPVIAVSVFITLAATALHEHPASRAPLRAGDDAHLYRFAQEVRRFYPFFPVTVARVKRDFEWRGYTFAAGTRAMLDIHGTNHDRRVWGDPGVFRPERFAGRPDDRFEFVAQGGGQHATHHRCPGEWITLGLIKRALVRLAGAMTYEVPEQDLSIDFQRLPALPRSGFVMTRVGE